MFKRSIWLLIILIASHVIFAQDEPYTWQPYGLTVIVPDGWAISPSDNNDTLILMPTQSALDNVLASNEADLPIISIIATGNISQLDDLLFDAVSSRRRIEGELDSHGYTIAEDFMPESSTRRTDIIQLNSHYVMFASAPRELWDDFEPDLEMFLDSIVDAPLYDVSLDMMLTQPASFKGMSFMIPADWNFLSAGPYHNLYLLISERERRSLGATFTPNELSLEVLDLTAMRAVLADDILFTAQLFYFNLENDRETNNVTPLDTVELGNTKIIGLDYRSEHMAGRAYFIRNKDHAYIIAGLADPSMWDTSEKALFEAIWATLVIP